jgi:HSP90 family molecular chaperone
MPKRSPKSPSLEVTVKLAMLHTIANTIYPSTARKIREAAANAIDNGASWFIIHADRETNTLSLFDNGNGITKGRFKEIFKNLGVGLLKGGPEERLSYFGLGLISIFRLGKKAKIFTKPHGEKKTLCLDVDTDKIFDTKIEKEPIGFLSQCIKLSDELAGA